MKKQIGVEAAERKGGAGLRIYTGQCEAIWRRRNLCLWVSFYYSNGKGRREEERQGASQHISQCSTPRSAPGLSVYQAGCFRVPLNGLQ